MLNGMTGLVYFLGALVLLQRMFVWCGYKALPIMGSGNVSEIYICGLIVCPTLLAHAAC